MRKLYFIFVLTILSGFAFVSCLDETSLYVKSRNNEHELTIADAKSFFEDRASNLDVCNTKAYADEMPKYLLPGDFTPFWDNAQVSNDAEVSNVDVPIIGEYRYKAYRNYRLDNKIKAYIVEISHKLVVTKSKKTDEIESYMLTLIPDEKCYAKDKRHYSDGFISKNDKNDFSGWVIYSLWEIKIPFLAEYYVDGVKMESVVIPKVNGRQSRKSTAFRKFISSIDFTIARSSVQTRSGEDSYDSFGDWFMNEIWPDAENGDNYEMKGNEEDGWYLEDQDGNEYEIPDGVGDDPFGDFDDEEDSEPRDETDWMNDLYGDSEIDGELTIGIYCPICGKLLATFLVSEWENVPFYYCPNCKKYFDGNVY